MAGEEGRGVYVHGLPAEEDHDRLRDKLLIYFLRPKNGGGEVTSLTFSGPAPMRALVIFEESRVAQSVLHHHPHVFQLDGRSYNLSISLASQDPLNLDTVILDMAVNIDCRPFPQGAEALSVLHCYLPDLLIQRDLLQNTCRLQGSYSDCQSALLYIEKMCTLHPSKTQNVDLTREQRASLERRDNEKQSWTSSDQIQPAQQTLEDVPSASPESWRQEDYGLQRKHRAWLQTNDTEEGADSRAEELKIEDLSLMMETEIFEYLKNIQEYGRILRSYEVNVVDVTSEGVSMVYLQSDVPREPGVTQKIRQAHKELKQLYQQIEGCLRKDLVKISVLSQPPGLTAKLQSVQSVLPSVLLSYDQENVHIVGERSDVFQAKQMLLGLDKNMSPMFSRSPMPPRQSSDKPSHVNDKTQLHSPVVPKLFDYSGDKTEAGGQESKQAAGLKTSGDLKGVGAKISELALASSSQRTLPTTSSTFGTLGLRSTQEPESPKKKVASRTGEDFLLSRTDPSLNMISTNGNILNIPRAKPIASDGAPVYAITSSSSIPGSSTSNKDFNIPTRTQTNSSAPLRNNTFLDHPIRPEQVQQKEVNPDQRASGFSSGRPVEDRPDFQEEVIVSIVMWNYLKKVYSNQLKSLKSDLQMSERQDGRAEVSVTLQGPESWKVSEGHQRLQKLITAVASDFYAQELDLENLEVFSEKLVETFCMRVQSRFPTVLLHIFKGRVFLSGPKSKCSQVSSYFKEEFHTLRSYSLSEEDVGEAQTSKRPAKANGSLKEFSSPEGTPRLKRADQLAKQKCVSAESLENHRLVKNELSKAVTEPRENLTRPYQLQPQKIDSCLSSKTTNLKPHKPSEQCLCGATGADVQHIGCGVVLCSACQSQHQQCKVCENGEFQPSKNLQEEAFQHGAIQGDMTCVETTLSLEGYPRHTTAKITYSIPDGIQGDKDPCPGSSFQGGVFVAYLPLDPKGRRLLPLLEMAFHRGLTFTINPNSSGGAKVAWAKIPHKTNMSGGKSKNAFPDSSYLGRLSRALVAHGIENVPAMN